jgi:hypothetical protein
VSARELIVDVTARLGDERREIQPFDQPRRQDRAKERRRILGVRERALEQRIVRIARFHRRHRHLGQS